jgi:hypothetical protein
MKKLYFLLLLIITFTSFSQTPIITAIVDGDCEGGAPKLLEIFASGTVDFSLYTIEKQTNGNTTWGNSDQLTALGIITDSFVYISKDADLSTLKTDFPSLNSATIIVSSTLNVNGNDRVRIIETGTNPINVIDQFGVEGLDGSGTSWEYTDSYAKRINGTGPDGGFIEANWNTPGKNALKGGGLCQLASSFESMMGGIGTYVVATAGLGKNNIPDFSIFPNPVTKNKLFINSLNSSDKEIRIFDILGKEVLSTTLKGRELNLTKLSPGIYILKALQEGKTATRKLVIK